MDIAMIGLGKMGANMTTRMLRGGHSVVAFDLNEDSIQAAEAQGADGARTLDEIITKLASPRAVWVMVPAGNPTESTITALAEILSPDDIIIDGGNSNYKDSIRRAVMLEEKGIFFVHFDICRSDFRSLRLRCGVSKSAVVRRRRVLLRIHVCSKVF